MIGIGKIKEKHSSLETLASKPEETITKMVNYLKNAIDDKNNYNIGITGSYGSGKSTIIKSYENKANKKLLYISLAILNENNDDNSQASSSLEERLEKAIVNQIIHQIDPSYIPQSFLKSKKEKNYFLNTGFISVGILLLLLNIHVSYNYIISILSNKFLLNLMEKSRLYFAVGFVAYSIILIYHALKNFNFSSIIKLKSELYEFEANTNQNESDSSSYFDKHLDDILYCISQSRCDAIVFEDIDRFNNQEIFIKLKEINNLLNNRYKFGRFRFLKKIKNYFIKPKKIPFIYAMNDDLFKSNDKTKFFDIVIPVIPYINGDNSAETFDILFKTQENIKPDRVVLSILSHYITDMRLLKNIYNEYIIYIGILDSDSKKFKKHDYNQLFSLIVYKNLYPTDFANLQYSKGSLYNVINSRSKIVQEKKQSLIEQIKQIEEEVKRIENEFLQNEYELDILYSYELHSYRDYPSKPLIYSLKNNFFPSVNKNDSKYKDRLQFIQDKHSNQVGNLRKQLNMLDKQLQRIQIEKLSNLITNVEDIEKFFEKQRVDKLQLLFIRTLLVNDFVNEDYRRYLSHFRNGTASDNDINFIKSVNAKDTPKYDIELENIKWVLDKIVIETLHNNYAVLNYSLIYYLLYNEMKEKEYQIYIQILDLIEHYKNNEKYIFIIGFYKYCLDKDLIKNKDLLNDLYKNNPQLVSDIFLCKTPITPDNYAVIYYSVIRNSNIIDIDNIYYNEDESIKKEISEYVSIHSDIFLYDYIIKDVYWNYLENFNIKFQYISYINKENLEDGKLERFLNYIFLKDLYVINEDNINYIVDNYIKLRENEPVQDKSNYEIYLHNISNKPIVLNEFIKLLNLNIDDSIKFEYSEDIKKLIINNEDIDVNDVLTFLEKYEIIIDDISIVRDELWNDLLISPSLLIKPIWSNIIIYYDKFHDSDTESHIKEFLLQHNMNDKLNTNENIELFKTILRQEIETDKFLDIIQTFEQCDAIPIDISISKDNMKKLLQHNIFAPTKENFDICYAKYNNLFHFFIVNNTQIYIDSISSYVINKEQLEYIANVNSIDIQSLYIIVHHYFTNNAYASYRDIKISNMALLEKIFKSELDKNIKTIVFTSNIDVIIKDNELLLSGLSYIMDYSIYNRIENLFNIKQKYIRLSLTQGNNSKVILDLLIDKNILIKKEYSQHIELSLSDEIRNKLQNR